MRIKYGKTPKSENTVTDSNRHTQNITCNTRKQNVWVFMEHYARQTISSCRRKKSEYKIAEIIWCIHWLALIPKKKRRKSQNTRKVNSMFPNNPRLQMQSEHNERCGPQEKQCSKGWHEKKMPQINSLRSSAKKLARRKSTQYHQEKRTNSG